MELKHKKTGQVFIPTTKSAETEMLKSGHYEEVKKEVKSEEIKTKK